MINMDCTKYKSPPYPFCCRNECNEHEFCRGCTYTYTEEGECNEVQRRDASGNDAEYSEF